MKALIICSIHALCDISQLERDAYNRTCAHHGLPETLTVQNHTRILATTTMLEVLNHLPAPNEQRKDLIGSYLDLLNDKIWSLSLRAYQSVFATLLDPKSYARPTRFISDYPILTTNLVRSAALLTNATKLGQLTTPSDPLNVQSVSAGLQASAATLNMANNEIEVLVAHRRDFVVAQSLGMDPRFVDELRPKTNPQKQPLKPRFGISTGPEIDTVSLPMAAAAPV